MGVSGSCSEEFASVSGTVYNAEEQTVTFSDCQAYQVQSGDRIYTIVEKFYGTTDPDAEKYFAEMNNVDPETFVIDVGWWLWLPIYVVSSAGNVSLSCTYVFPPCTSISTADLHGVSGSATQDNPANGACAY